MAKGVDVENYPGVARARGSGIIQDMRAQALSFFADLREDTVHAVDVRNWPFSVYLNSSQDTTSFRTESLIVATGADSRWLGVKGEDELRGHGVSSCAACDGPLFRGKNCVVIGGGDSAAEESLFLSRLCASVTLIHRRDQLRAGKLLQQRVLGHPKVTVIWNSVVQEFLSEKDSASPRLVGVILKHIRSGDILQRHADAAFVAIGHDPNTGLFGGQLRMLSNTGYLETLGRSSHTSVPGVFAAGDVADPVYWQAITAAGSGAAAAIDAERWLSMRSAMSF